MLSDRVTGYTINAEPDGQRFRPKQSSKRAISCSSEKEKARQNEAEPFDLTAIWRVPMQSKTPF